MTPSARTIWGSKRKIFRGQYNIGARGQFALDFPLMTGNEEILRKNKIFSELITLYRKKVCNFAPNS